MFTGIVAGSFPIVSLDLDRNLLRYSVALPETLLEKLEIGASVAVDGVCQTVTQINNREVSFDAIEETLLCTTLAERKEGDCVNIERSLCVGDEIGGHFLSGHIACKGQVTQVNQEHNNRSIQVECPEAFAKYLFPKGFIAVNGVSLTLGECSGHHFLIHLIPETLHMTNLEGLEKGSFVNLEFDSQTVATVLTVERVLQKG